MQIAKIGAISPKKTKTPPIAPPFPPPGAANAAGAGYPPLRHQQGAAGSPASALPAPPPLPFPLTAAQSAAQTTTDNATTAKAAVPKSAFSVRKPDKTPTHSP